VSLGHEINIFQHGLGCIVRLITFKGHSRTEDICGSTEEAGAPAPETQLIELSVQCNTLHGTKYKNHLRRVSAYVCLCFRAEYLENR